MDVSVIVPTYREADNLPLLVPRIAGSLNGSGISWELAIVDDDSRDGTPAVSTALAERYPVRLLVRRGERGLASAVLFGITQVTGNVVVVMDADLSHPPERIPELVSPVLAGECDLAIGSRYVQGGATDVSWKWYRRLNSRVATLLARPLTPVRDCLAGFFAVQRASLSGVPLNPVGYKILLEILVRVRGIRVAEIPIMFSDRRAGQSKLNWREQLNYLRHLGRLYRYAAGTAWVHPTM